MEATTLRRFSAGLVGGVTTGLIVFAWMWAGSLTSGPNTSAENTALLAVAFACLCILPGVAGAYVHELSSVPKRVAADVAAGVFVVALIPLGVLAISRDSGDGWGYVVLIVLAPVVMAGSVFLAGAAYLAARGTHTLRRRRFQ